MCLKKGVKAHHLCLTAAIHAAMVWCTVLRRWCGSSGRGPLKTCCAKLVAVVVSGRPTDGGRTAVVALLLYVVVALCHLAANSSSNYSIAMAQGSNAGRPIRKPAPQPVSLLTDSAVNPPSLRVCCCCWGFYCRGYFDGLRLYTVTSTYQEFNTILLFLSWLLHLVAATPMKPYFWLRPNIRSGKWQLFI